MSSHPDATPGSQLKTSIMDATRKIESIIDDAERAATEIRADAKADAERESKLLIAESAARVAAVVEPLDRRVENLRAEAAALMSELESAVSRLAELTMQALEQDARAPETTQVNWAGTESANRAALRDDPELPPGPAPVAYPGTGASDPAPSEPPEEAVLRATQMAVAGNSRSEIEATLADEFGLGDATPLVDEILGPA